MTKWYKLIGIVRIKNKSSVGAAKSSRKYNNMIIIKIKCQTIGYLSNSLFIV